MDKGSFVILYDNGSYNKDQGYEVSLSEATRYRTREEAEKKSEDFMGVVGVIEIELDDKNESW